MKKLLFSVASVIFAISAMAQEQVAPEQNVEQFATYNRSSVSVIALSQGDEWDEVFLPIVENYTISTKFDINKISTKVIAPADVVRTTPKDSVVHPVDETVFAPQVTEEVVPDSSVLGKFANIMGGMASMMDMLMPAKADAATQEAILAYLNENNVGKEILSYILARDAEGKFSRAILDERSAWNATDEDVAADQALQVKRFGQDGNTLIKSSFLTVYDMKNPTKTVTKNDEGEEKISWSAVVSAYVYEIEDAEAVVENVLGNMWINDDDDAETKAAKKAAFDSLQVTLKLSAAEAVKVSGKHLDAALKTSYEKTLSKLEKKIDAWKVTAPCETVRPYITAKVGTKEGIKNADRYAVYGQKWNKKTEASEYKRIGYARATVVADNMKVADGQSDSTYFYQIGGGRLKGDFTEIVKQSNDLKLGVRLGGGYCAISNVNLGLEYLGYIHKNGISHYGIVDLGAGFSEGTTYFDFGIGYQIGLKLKQVMEFQVFAKYVGDIDLANYALADDDEKSECMAHYVDPGLRIVINCGYPFQLYVQGSYAVPVAAGYYYTPSKGHGADFANQWNIGGGIKINL
jgi:hypothetical protein